MQGRTILLDGFSKSYAMTGWRLGYGVMPPELAEHVARLMVNSNSCTATFVQLAGIAALQGDQTPVAAMVAEFKRRRDLLVDGLNRLPGVRCARPRGAFYVFPNITGTGRSSAAVAERLLTEAGVAAVRCGVQRSRRLSPVLVCELEPTPTALERMRQCSRASK
jgi:aspartate/methionine/tyrosine aminotransferase